VSFPPEDRNAELRNLFFESAEELLQTLNDEALLLEKSPGDPEALRSLRRTVHTLKGDAAACGYRELSELAHELEDVLMLDQSAAAASVPDIALRAADIFGAMLEAYRQEKSLPDADPLRRAITKLAVAGTTAGTRQSEKKGKQTFRWNEYERLAIRKAIESGHCVRRVSVQLDPLCGMPIAARQMLRGALQSIGEVLAVYPPDGSPAAVNQLEFAVASEEPGEILRKKCRIPTISSNVRTTVLRNKTHGGLRQGTPSNTSISPQLSNPEIKPAAPGATEETPVQPFPSVHDNLLRVDAEKIDDVLNLVGELILAKSMMQQAMHEFSQRFLRDSLQAKFADAMGFQSRVLNDLQRSVMKIRMVPVEQLFRRFPRVVRDVALQCGKEVELSIRGGDTDLDKGILDALAEPLTHLVRNAIGHGIETGAERLRAGKPAKGKLRLNAYHQGNQVVIELSDDGQGIDPEKVRQKAIRQGLLTTEQAARMSEPETLELIFRPGFSTAEEITELSGRGVGLDVVQSVLQRMKGTAQIETEAGRGTTFRLRLPLTLAIIRALLFRVEERLYAIPLNTVVEIARTVESEIHEVEHFEVLQLRGEVLPLLRLGRLPEPGIDATSTKVFVLVIHSGDRKFGLIVDALDGEKELVIKALDDQSVSTDLVSGASILGDGRVVLIINLGALVERFTRNRPEQPGERTAGLLLPQPRRAAAAAGGQA
jgi:two-component system chemotaxis sensor kinase CheA